MSHRRWLIIPLLLAISLAACQSASRLNTTPTTTQSQQHVSTTPDLNQAGWNDGPGHLQLAGTSGYLFSSGIYRTSDNTIELSRFTTAGNMINDDLNGDGYRDIIVANSGNYEFIESPFAQIRKQNEDHSKPNAQIYWGSPHGYDAKQTIGIAGDRPSSLAVMDFNLDGILDIAVAGGGEFHPPYVNSYVYWGTKNGYSEQNSIALPTYAATGTAAGDLNKDGYPDLVFANLGDYHFPFPPTLIYWGGPQGFSPQHRTELETQGVGGLELADVNKDGWLDVVIGNSAGFPPIDQLMDYGQNYAWPDSYIYLGGPEGFSAKRRIALPTKGATGVKVADLNKDGYLDIVFANAGSFALPPLPDTYIYWGGPNGYTPTNRTDLHTNGASGVSIADLNKDGWLDLVLSVTGTYLYIGKPKFPDSYVYWGAPTGFSDDRRLALPTEASQGSITTDMNGDGILDIVFSQLGDFNQPYRPVLIYYGTNDKNAPYSLAKSGTLPSQISYGSVAVGAPDGGDHMSHGNVAIPIYDRADTFVAQGTLVSSVYTSGSKPAWTSLDYTADVPAATSAILTVEHSSDGLTWSEGGRVKLQSGQHTLTLANAGVQLGPSVRYKLMLESSNGTATPQIQSIHFH